MSSTLCTEVRAARHPVAIDHVREDALYCDHPTPRRYGFESYISVPIILQGGVYFGNLCAIDPRPRRVSDPGTVSMFTLFAELISAQLENEARQLETESALLDARQTAELREQFIAVLGHDLRNPLASMSVTAEVLARRVHQPEIAGVGRRLHASALRMSRLIEDVMDFARGRLGSGLGVSLVEEQDLAMLLRNVVEELRQAHPDRVILDHIQLSEPARCDRGRIQQLLSNLLGNALTHGDEAEPIQVEVVMEAHAVVLAVTNRGVPIAPEHLEKIFEPYWRPPTSKPGGLGLGLHICAQIVAAHGGRLDATSSADGETCFTARWPTGLGSR